MTVTSFPTWMYHATLGARIMRTADELAAAGDGWVDSPVRTTTQPEPVPMKRRTKEQHG